MKTFDSSSDLRLLWVGCLGFGSVLTGFAQETVSQEAATLADHVTFQSTFDGGVTAEIAKGDGRLFTAANWQSFEKAEPGLKDPGVVIAKGRGLHGDALEFKQKKRLVTFYQADRNVAYSDKSWSGAISFWLQLDPARDLEPGYCDPIQVTDSAYNDAAIWVDFTKENPRDFRLGIIGDREAWNPQKIPPDENPEFERRLIAAKQPPFARGKWTHVLINFIGLNSDEGRSEFYLDGKQVGSLDVEDPFTWEQDKARMLLGLNYVGLFDELAIFDRPLNEGEVTSLYRSKGKITERR